MNTWGVGGQHFIPTLQCLSGQRELRQESPDSFCPEEQDPKQLLIPHKLFLVCLQLPPKLCCSLVFYLPGWALHYKLQL